MRAPPIGPLALAVALAAGTGAAASRVAVAAQKPYDVEFVPPSSTARWLSLGHPLTAGNFYWLRAVQYIGEERADQRGWERLFPLVDLATDLDPGHGYAYQVAGVILGSAGRVKESSAILEKGTRQCPDRYILPYLRSFNAFYFEDDWALAGRYAEIAAKTPGAPDHVRQNALAYYVKGKRAEAAVAFLEHSLEEAKDEETRKALQAQLEQARLEWEAERIDEAIEAFRARYGVRPVVIESLVLEKLLDAIPPDPFGGEYYVGDDGRAHSTAHPYRFAPRPSRQELQMTGYPAPGSGKATP